jgi:hypothetical protein
MKKVCTSCHTHAESKKVAPGSFVFEIFLWLILMVPGFLYSVWRRANKKHVCRACGSDQVIDPVTPRGQQILKLKLDKLEAA